MMQERLQYLFTQYLENRSSRKELEEFFGYVRKAEHDESLRLLIRKLYDQMKPHESAVTRVDEKGQLIFNDQIWSESLPAPRKRKALYALVVTAGVAIVVSIATGIWLKPAPNSRTQSSLSSLTKKTTARDESKLVVLQDSTKVWLNAASTLEFPDQFNDTLREVYLSGEAYFDVKHADRIPFIIHTGNVSTTVLGTAFNIKAYPGERNIIVSVSRGKVRINRGKKLLTTLIKGQQARVEDKGNGLIEKQVREDNISSWQQGNIIYEDERFSEILSDLERIYNTKIDLQNNLLRDVLVTTSFKKESGVEQALQALCKLTDSGLTRNGTVYVIR